MAATQSADLELQTHADEAAELLALHNQARVDGVKCGWFIRQHAAPLSWNQQLAAAAQQQVRAMAKQQTLTHSAGGNTKQRLAQVGYRWSRYAENIGFAYRDANAAFDGWINSKAHCQNIMDEAQREFGAAHYQGYWSVIIAAPKA
ncbi:cysteine-rich secretory family protein [Arenicella xantha]|uniref:Cysteine-rich secretory family protein n=2 Tax=Arenicella xantha TaxID=644221 RepID=A0A395JLM6_9GAMM|nr:cysteine-rich secretory family protein [Arenicella xantha]